VVIGYWLNITWIPAGVYPVPQYGAAMTIVKIHFTSDSSFVVPAFAKACLRRSGYAQAGYGGQAVGGYDLGADT